MRKTKTTSTRKRQQILRDLLEERRREIHQKLRSLRETLPAEVSEVRDAEEHSLDDFVHDVDFALMQMKSETLLQIDEAIRRIETGAYGECAECGDEIASARLAALPFAELCRDCQADVESLTVEEPGIRAVGARLARELTPPRR
jgi:DnaK suppressor protein